MYEHFFQCPYCWEEISMLLDTSVTKQTYIEDCEVCCRPIEVMAQFSGEELVAFDALDIGQ
jgi:transcription elongation factor Elf1